MTGLLAGPIGSLLQAAAGAITGLVDFSVTLSSSAVSGITAPVPSAALSGDLLVVVALHSSTFGVWSGAGWTEQTQSRGRYLSSRTWDGINNTYSYTTTRSANKTLVMLVFRGYSMGANSTIPTSASTSTTAASFTIPANNSIVIGVPHSSESGADWGPLTNWSKMLATSTGNSLNIWRKNALQPSGVAASVFWSRNPASGVSSNAAFQFSLSPV